MKKKQRHLKKSVKFLFLFLLILLCIIIIIFCIPKKQKNHIFKTENEIEITDTYQSKISYPQMKDKDFNQKITSMIEEKKKTFQENVKKLEKDTVYEINISYEIEDTTELSSIHFVIQYFLGGAHYTREDVTYYYNYRLNKEVSLSDIIHSDEESLKKLSQFLYIKLDENYHDELFNDDILQSSLEPTLDNFQHILFSNNQIKIIFPPYQVAPWSSGELVLYINYDEFHDYLKEPYQKMTKEEKEPEVVNNRKTRDLNTLKDKKLVAFTFDDGPSWNTTEKLLNELEKRDARVSFFVLGNRVEQLPEIVQRAYQNGHTIGSHTYDHKNLVNLDTLEVTKEIAKTNQIIENVIHDTVHFLRPPYGSYNQSILENSNLSFILWDVDTLDWKNRNTEATYQNIMREVEDGSIILLHDLYETSIDAALRAMDTLQEQGYAFVSLEELQQIKGNVFQIGKSYFSIPQ